MFTVDARECDHRDRGGLPVVLLLTLAALLAAGKCHAQDDFYPLPQPNRSPFGFPWPPPAPDEPGVTLHRRYMLDGYPELQFQPRPEDEIWLVSTREISDECTAATREQLVCKHPVGSSWNRVPVDQLLDVQRLHPDRATVIFIHGNRTPAFWARRRGQMAYQCLVGNQSGNVPPVRFIIWSWPSDEIPNPLQDFRRKMDRSLVDGCCFGRFLSWLDPHQAVSLMTYSMGTQIGFTGVESATRQFGSCPPVGMIAMAPVTHCRWQLTADRVRTLNDRIFRFRLCRNPKDIALRAYRKVCSLECKTCYQPGAERFANCHPDVRQYDFSQSVGREHNILGYVSQPQVRLELEALLR
jgi:hypothetical protein